MASLLVAGTVLISNKIRSHKEAKKEAKRMAYEKRYEELEEEHKKNQREKRLSQKVVTTTAPPQPQTEPSPSQQQSHPRSSDVQDRSSLRRRDSSDSLDDPARWVNDVVKEHSLSKSVVGS